MNKILSKTLLAASLMLLITLVSMYAADLSVGATAWYTAWDFNSSNNQNNTEFDPTFLYGPALSVKFSDDYNLTFVFLYGKFDMHETNSTNKMSRTDSDLALNYRLNNYFKIFAGAKYMSYKMPDFNHSSTGPGAGLSVVVPVGGDFFILGNISGLYLWGKDDTKDSTDKFNEYGANSSIAAAYYIASTSTTISLGGRYQYFKTDYDGTGNSRDLTHKFYGVTLSANYSFSI